jgi:hypothetical protein
MCDMLVERIVGGFPAFVVELLDPKFLFSILQGHWCSTCRELSGACTYPWSQIWHDGTGVSAIVAPHTNFSAFSFSKLNGHYIIPI